MGLRRWAIVILIAIVSLGGATELVNRVSGPYDFNCVSSSPRGFSVVIRSWKTGQTSSVPVPIGGCPDWSVGAAGE